LLLDYALTHRPIATLNPSFNYGEVYYIVPSEYFSPDRL
jgi:hypothetical protein